MSETTNIAKLATTDLAIADCKEATLLSGNAAMIARAMRSAGAKKLEMSYEGSGDSGDVVDISILDGADIPIKNDTLPNVEISLVKRRYDEATDKWIDVVSSEACSFDVAASYLLDDVIEHFDHSGYENNDGGRGTLTLDAVTGELELEHSDYYTESNTSFHSLGSLQDNASADATPTTSP